MQDLRAALAAVFGFSDFRAGQGEVVRQLLAGHSSLAIFPTGSGKSLCYQFTALQLPHLTLVVSPLLALMKDQLEFLAQKGIAAASLDSTLSAEQSQQVMADVRQGRIKILMVSVERFKNERFRQFISAVPLSMLVVDEAHCISEWGHNFRPDYLKLPDYRRQLNIPLVLLLTATATRKVKRDMAEKFAINPAHIVQTGFYRENLHLSVLPVVQAEKDKQLLQLIRQQQGSGIVYVTLQNTAEQVAEMLQRAGISALAYHAGFEDAIRQDIQNQFMQGRVQVVVATIAFGMGIDKSDIRFVMHYDLPKSIENYSQEIGRAGRDNSAAECITLANLDGLTTLENFVYGDTPELSGIEYVLQNIRQECRAAQWEVQLVTLSNNSNVRQLPLKTLLVQLELRAVIKPLYAYYADFKYRLLQSENQILAQFEGERREFLAAIFKHTDFKKVWGSANFEVLYAQYGCERSRVVAALEYLHEKNMLELSTSKITDVYAVDENLLNQASLATELQQYFAEKEQSEIKRIAALVRFFELDTCLSFNLARYFDDQVAPQFCGHCSVCRGQVATLSYSSKVAWPADEYLRRVLAEFSSRVKQDAGVFLSVDLCCRFLAGISVPLFTRLKLRQQEGFACCEQQAYGQIREKVGMLIGAL
ncbi:MAG: RecQ family ATP-dependent DNA helicase [Oceanospirillaceae bacterium]|nr:RecQ family ATP-dependent DNA helicase [Oceanospirillaceae bacterium]MCP5335380.1 RecQ family ATP-dependent DNA helicase [Oceanospirillaceae bacterium]